MKTETLFHFSDLSIQLVEAGKKNPKEKMERAFTSDNKNHRFALIENKSIHDPNNWDPTWFTAYE